MARRKLGRKARKLAHKLAPELMREVIAIALVALTILLVIAFFGGGGVLTDVVLKNLRVVIGYGSYGLPLLLLILAWRLFMAHRHEVTIATYVGLIMLVVSLAGLWHVGVDQNQTLIVAQDGRGGGLAGYLVSKGLLSLLNPVSSAIILMALILIGLVLILNVKISELFAKLIERWRRRKEEAAGELGKATEATPKINAKVPIVTSQTEPETEAPVEHEVLTSRSDPDWVLPSLDLLEDKSGQADAGKPQENAEVIEKTLANFGI
ncbi:DNA translocase FtsK 4TM domain-containing protein, partial [Candidatus Microgenomates bacterium]|nr:DNA translocase FtsK 4TM domain-containing protein [Candidatus Microgenomates bacterium]